MNNNDHDDDMVPLGYINNENPYSYCKDYNLNAINLPEKRSSLTALQRIQPTKVSFRMPLKHVENEKQHLLNYAVESEKKVLIKKGLAILGVEYHDSPEDLFERNLDIEEILDIAVQIKKLNLYYHQRRLRSKVATALSKSHNNPSEMKISTRKALEIDNLKDALVYCKLEELYHESEK